MKSINQISNDFIAIFNSLWYRDFPTAKSRIIAQRADWTTHLNICARRTADLLGFFTHFESGGRTDAVIKDNRQNPIAYIEFEWNEPHYKNFNEVTKLHDSRQKCFFSLLISYSGKNKIDINLQKICSQWRQASEPLIVILIIFHNEKYVKPDGKNGSFRSFESMQTYLIKNNSCKLLRKQPALPSDAKNRRWENSSGL